MSRSKLAVALYKVISEFNLAEAYTLSDAMHIAESTGYEMTPTEERLWFKLTEMIESHEGT